MKKEQFKKEISELISYYVGNMVQYNVTAANNKENESLLRMLQGQSQVTTYTFEQELDRMIDAMIPEQGCDCDCEEPCEECTCAE